MGWTNQNETNSNWNNISEAAMGWTGVTEPGASYTPVGITSSIFSISQQFLDDTTLSFGTNFDFGVTYHSATSQLTVSNLTNGNLAVFDEDGINALVFSEQSTLPVTPTKGSLVLVQNEFYVGLDS